MVGRWLSRRKLTTPASLQPTFETSDDSVVMCGDTVVVVDVVTVRPSVLRGCTLMVVHPPWTAPPGTSAVASFVGRWEAEHGEEGCVVCKVSGVDVSDG